MAGIAVVGIVAGVVAVGIVAVGIVDPTEVAPAEAAPTLAAAEDLQVIEVGPVVRLVPVNHVAVRIAQFEIAAPSIVEAADLAKTAPAALNLAKAHVSA